MEVDNIFSSYYLAPIEYFYYLKLYNIVYQDIHEHFIKQTYRNRCCILSPNGVQSLSIPLINAKKQKAVKEMKITYDENWQKKHWKSFEAAYRRSPYFEFYENEFYPFYHEKKYQFLVDFNTALEEKTLELLNLSVNLVRTDKYIDNEFVRNDYRNMLSPKKPSLLMFKNYIQVFSDRNGFSPNLSIVDLLFNEGPNASNYLNIIAEN